MDTTHPSLGQPQGYACRKLRIVDYTLDDADLETRCLLDNGRHKIQPRNSVGQLDVLPLEIVTDVLVALDLPTLTAFRRVNRRAMSLVDSLHQYGTVLKHCPNVLRAIISIDANYFDCRSLYKTLSTSKCETCDRFGGYLYLITCKRVCYFCFTSNLEYLPISATYAAKHTGLSRKELKHLPHILSLPGRYTAFDKQSKNRIMLYDWQVVLNRTSKVSIQSFVERMQEQDHTTREPRRYMSIISAPYFSSLGHSADWGFHCAGCIDDTEPATHFRIRYTRDAILDHIGRHSGKPENQVEGDA
ncbi:hypothetical protein B0O99DRAFT_692758 [Bisporella sp. PMI_857]|nr:hypothetical protein B0O99DRAFT_692758 [Bisporella sp. PMI_857]